MDLLTVIFLKKLVLDRVSLKFSKIHDRWVMVLVRSLIESMDT